MLLQKPAPIVLTKRELCKSVAKRLKKSNPELSPDSARRKTKHAIKVLKEIQNIPSYSQVINMTHRQLILFLQSCPESPYFATDEWELDEP